MGVLLLVVLGTLLSRVFADAIEVWSSQDYLSFGFLVPPVVIALLWSRRRELRASKGAGGRGALALLGAALVAYIVFERVSAKSPAAVAAGLLIWSVCVYLWGWRVGRRIVLPLTLLTFSLAIQQTLISPVGFALQQATAVGATWSSQLLGLPIVRDGLVLRGDAYAFIVAEECSGMNSLLALLGLSITWLALVQGRTISRFGVVLSVLPLILGANVLRVVLVLLVAANFGQDAATGFFHGASSLVLFATALMGMLLLSRILGCRASVLA